MSISRLVSALICFGLVLGAAPASGRPGPPVTCSSCLVVDESGRALWARLPDKPAPIASATKMVTALVTVAHASLKEEVRVSSAAAATPGGKLSLIAGESFTVKELLAALLLNSSNDAAVVLAEHVAGEEPAFVQLMNEAAVELGAQGTRFANPHGLDADGHLSTARDLALIGAAVLEDDLLSRLVSSKERTITSDERTANLENTNLLLGDYVGLIGIKTGFTAGAGNVLVAAAERGGRRLIAVAMHSDDAFIDASALLDRGFAELARNVLVAREQPIAEMIFGGGAVVQVQTGARFRGPQLPAAVTTFFTPNPHVSLPVAAGAELGEVRILHQGSPIASIAAVAATSVPRPQEGWVERGLVALLAFGGRVQSAFGSG